MKLRKLLLGAGVLALGVSLASCSEKEVRNTTTPYGELNGKLDTVIAEGKNGTSLTLGTYYNKLKVLGYSKITSNIDRHLYAKEIAAVEALYKATDLNSLGNHTDVLAIPGLYELNDAKVKELKIELLESINTLIATKVYGTADYDAIQKKTQAELNKAINTFIDSQNKVGITVTATQLKDYIGPKDSGYELTPEKNLIQFDKKTIEILKPAYDAAVLDYAKQLASRKALFEIADKEYIKEKDEDGKEKDVKNDFYIFKDNAIENLYDSTYKTYGTYKAIIIQFNSLKEAQDLLASFPIDNSSFEAAKASYVKLYNEYYKYKTKTGTVYEDEVHTYKVSKLEDDFAELPASVSTLVKTTLKDQDYLTEPRNVNNKYVLALRGETKYDVKNSETETDFADLDADNKTKYTNLIKVDLINNNAKSYQATEYQKRIEAAEIEIYDPYFEYKFETANSSFYDNYTGTVKATDNALYSIDGDKYLIEDFYKEASDEFASAIITEHFQLEYANAFYNDFVKLQLISKDANKDNKKALDEAIKTFNSNKNSTYPAEIGLDNYLLAAYGYNNKDQVMKYYYDAKAALSTYKSVLVFDDWAKQIEKDGKMVWDIENAKKGILGNILATGNATYNDLFSINLDHILINIDDNGDGQPDDPEDFLQKNPDIRDEFEAAVVNLAQAIYKEAIHPDYKNNTLYETLTYIKTQYEEGGVIRSQENKTWDDFKADEVNGANRFSFLLTVEQLASNGDINQESVNNFVGPFKDYVKNVYKTASAKENFPDEFDNGTFYIVSGKDEALTGEQLTTAEQADKITAESLCKTNFGYHLLVLNSYEGPKSTRYDDSDDVSGFQKNLQITLNKYKNEDGKDDDVVYVYTDSYNKNDKEASFEQFFIYYVQQANGVDSSLDSDIKQIMSSLFDGAINTYKSSNFQTYLILKDAEITIKSDFKLFGYGINQNIVANEITNLKHQVTSYDEASPYNKWFEPTMDWSRPALIVEK